MLLAHRLTSAGLEVADDPDALEHAAWVDVVDPTPQERVLLENLLRRPLEDATDADEIESSARSYVDHAGAHVSTLFLHRVEGRPENTNVTLVVRADRLLTVHDRDIPALRLLRLMVRRDPHLLEDPFGLLISLFETAVDDFGDTLQELYFGLEATGRRVFEESNTDLEAVARRSRAARRPQRQGSALPDGLAPRHHVPAAQRARRKRAPLASRTRPA